MESDMGVGILANAMAGGANDDSVGNPSDNNGKIDPNVNASTTTNAIGSVSRATAPKLVNDQ
jgi:hypothetical protein